MKHKFLLTVAGDTLDEMVGNLRKVNQTFGLSVTTNNAHAQDAIDAIAGEPLEPVEPVESAKPRRGRPKGSVNSEPAINTQPAVAEVQTLTRDAVNNALKSVLESKGLGAAQTILKTFGAKRASEVKDPDFGRFVEECQSALKA